MRSLDDGGWLPTTLAKNDLIKIDCDIHVQNTKHREYVQRSVQVSMVLRRQKSGESITTVNKRRSET